MSEPVKKLIPETRKIVRRSYGRNIGPATRLMNPSDFGQILKPFVFLDYFDLQGPPFMGELHPHSGIATLTYLIDGRIDLITPDGDTVVLENGGVEWMQAGKGMWHGGSIGDDRHHRVRGFQLWVALPPELENGPTSAVFLPTSEIPSVGPVQVLLGHYDGVASLIPSPTSMNYLGVKLRAGEKWTYVPPRNHTVLWISTTEEGLTANDQLIAGEEIVAFESSTMAVEFRALNDTHFVLGSSVPHAHDLSVGHYSVHTSQNALEIGENRIRELGEQLIKTGRLRARFF